MKENPEIKESTEIVDGTLLMKFEHQVRILDKVLKRYQSSPFGGGIVTAKEIVKGKKDLMNCLYSIGQYICLKKSPYKNQKSGQNNSKNYLKGAETYRFVYIGEDEDTSFYHKGDSIEIIFNLKCYFHNSYRFELTITKKEKNSLQESTQVEKYIILDNEIYLISMSNATLTIEDKTRGIKEPRKRYKVKFLPSTSYRNTTTIEENFIKSILTNTDYKHVDPVDTDNSAFSKFLKGPTYVNFHNRGNGPETGATYKSICYSDIEGVSTLEIEEIKSNNDGLLMYVYKALFNNKSVVFSLNYNNNENCSAELNANENISIPPEILAKLKDKVENAKKWSCKLAMSSNISSLFYENTIEQVSPNLG